MRCVLGSTRAQGHDPSGVVRGRVHLPEPGSRTTQFSFLSGMGGGGFRRERVVQRRWSHSRPVRSWLRPGLAGPFEPTRAGDSAGGSPRTPELGLHGRTKASQTRLLDAKFENKANLEKPEGTCAGQASGGTAALGGSRPATRGRISGVRVL